MLPHPTDRAELTYHAIDRSPPRRLDGYNRRGGGPEADGARQLEAYDVWLKGVVQVKMPGMRRRTS